MRITICGSMKFIREMERLENELIELGIEVYRPLSFEELGLGAQFDLEVAKEGEKADLKKEYDLVRMHTRKIDDSDGVLIANYMKNGIEGYIGGNTLIEIYHAFSTNKEIYFINDIPEVSYSAELEAMSPVVVGENISDIQRNYNLRPKVYVASKSELKINSVTQGLYKSDSQYRVFGIASDSKVSDQPFGFEEIYEGATNRIDDLQSQIEGEYSYLVSLENGLIQIAKSDLYFDTCLCVIEDKSGQREYSFSVGTKIPKKIVNHVLENNSEVGEYIRENMGVNSKDGVAALTNNRIKREELLSDTVNSCLSRFLIR